MSEPVRERRPRWDWGWCDTHRGPWDRHTFSRHVSRHPRATPRRHLSGATTERGPRGALRRTGESRGPGPSAAGSPVCSSLTSETRPPALRCLRRGVRAAPPPDGGLPFVPGLGLRWVPGSRPAEDCQDGNPDLWVGVPPLPCPGSQGGGGQGRSLVNALSREDSSGAVSETRPGRVRRRPPSPSTPRA